MHPEDLVPEEMNPLALALSGMPEVWRRLLTEHVADHYGRCLACNNSGTAGVPWPCTLQVAASDARDIHEAAKELAAQTPCGATS